MKTPCFLLDDAPGDGPWNMAVDEALLAAADERGLAAIRFYRWSEPTLSLGYFQAAADRSRHAPSRDLPMVRRQSGGGALVHDRELTYSIALPAIHSVTKQAPRLYRLVHDSLSEALAAQGVSVRTVGCGQQGGATNSCGKSQPHREGEPFLCFARRHPVDLVVEETGGGGGVPKVVGSAQRRRRGALLQHGSVLLDRSPATPELPGLQNASGREIDCVRLKADVAAHLLRALELAASQDALDDDSRSTAERLVADKYTARSWQFRR